MINPRGVWLHRYGYGRQKDIVLLEKAPVAIRLPAISPLID
jgi:hypothetical protein